MRVAASTVRYVFGAWMLVNGLNYYFPMFPLPPLSPAAQAFLTQLIASGLFDLAKVIEVIVGALLIVDLFVPAAIAMCMPVSVVIFFNNIILERGALGYIAGVVTLTLNFFLIAAYAQYFLPLLTMRSNAVARRELLVA